MYDVLTFKGISIINKFDTALTKLFNPSVSLRKRVRDFDKFLQKYSKVEIPVEHELIEGLYRRKVVFPKHMLATGKAHPKDHMDVMLKGEMLVATEDGFKHLIAPCTFTSRAHTKKAGIALEETVWLSYHATDAKTVEEAERTHACGDYDEFELQGDFEELN